ncbi:heterokaryon incompatibility protein-domain-containing protein [Tricladium varicosporioides]|nr:heterokaryon incompatibility protein-domain-containing protein [Hymenoscyphus varicosporioides]
MAAPKIPHRYHYTYQPLTTPRSFRLLRFRDFLHSELCELETFEIENCPPFSTLSYTWGAPLNTERSEEHYKDDKTKILIINTERGQQQLPLLKNLYEGLCQLTQSERPKWLWVDAICINQDDEAERASQVTFMGAVYSNCQQVIVWLGKDDSNMKDFKWLHEAFLPALWQYGETNGQETILETKWNVDLIKERLGMHTGKAWNSYAKFYHERRWFSRAWVMQELTLAPDVIILAGRSRLDWDDMTTLANIISLNGLGLLLQQNQPPSKRKNGQLMGFECLRLHTFRVLYRQLAVKNSDSTPASRSSTWNTISPAEPSPLSHLPETIVSSLSIKETTITKKTFNIARQIRASTDQLTNSVPGKTSEIARAIRVSSNKSISKSRKLLTSSPSPNLSSWGSVKTWSSTMKSKFNYLYGSESEKNRADATGFSQWTMALVDNLTPNSNRVDRWNTIFLCCIQWVRYSEATKLHDKIYGVLGIIDMLRPPDIPPPIYPDYSKSVEDIYASIAWYFIQNLPHLTLLSCVHDKHSRQLKTLPSWVPDFSCVSNEDLSFTVKSNWNASKAGPKQTYIRTLKDSILGLHGSCFDVIESTVSVFVPQNWSDGSHLPDGSVMSVEILGYFEKIIRFVCEGKDWPYEQSRLEVMVATLVAGHLTALPSKNSQDMPSEEGESYFPSFLPAEGQSTGLLENGKGLGIGFNPLPDWTSKSFRQPHQTSESSTQAVYPEPYQLLFKHNRSPSTSSFNTNKSPTTPASSQPTPDLPFPLSQPQYHSSKLTPTPVFGSPVPLTPHPDLKPTETFPYSKGVFQFRCWVLSMLIAGSLSPDTAPHVESILGAISQLTYLCPSSPGQAHLPARSEVSAAVSAARSLSGKAGFFKEKGLENATGVGDFVQGQFSEFDVRWSRMMGAYKMFRTRRGYLGMGPVSAEAGDQCWVLGDARVPFVLRGSTFMEGIYELVGRPIYMGVCMGRQWYQSL